MCVFHDLFNVAFGPRTLTTVRAKHLRDLFPHLAVKGDFEIKQNFNEPWFGPFSAPDPSTKNAHIMAYWKIFTVHQAISLLQKRWE